MIDPNQPAHPARELISHSTRDGRELYTHEHLGLTIRQHFAALAMQGILANPRLFDLMSQIAVNVNKPLKQVQAEAAVETADALIERLNLEPPHAAK